ncbi:MAG: hypothetical protein J6S92_06695, partial [Oscillospiraceae bacterium]|nr:hypothetical protein [Oscillospiraceae bacterium]
EYSEDAEEYQAEYDEPVQGTLFDPADEAEPEPEPIPRRKHTASRRLALDETDQLLNEAAAALNLELFTDDAPEEDAPLPEEPEQEPLPAAETPASEPETEPRHPRRIDVVPIDEDTMDIRI